MSYKKTDALMRHLRDSGISIQGPKQKRQLINTGYFHGYKGYRFFGNAHRRLPLRHMMKSMLLFNTILILRRCCMGK